MALLATGRFSYAIWEFLHAISIYLGREKNMVIDLESLTREAHTVLAESRRLFVLTGAGISAESGVPTFRGEGATWKNRRFDELATTAAFTEDPRLVWEWYLYRRRIIAGCEPNAAHSALAERTKRKDRVMTLITQNVDGLHERAGHPNVIRFHGSIWSNRCTGCGVERQACGELCYAELPLSSCCHALERPAIVWFGESLPDQALHAAFSALADADVMLVIGTSGTVQPASLFWQLAGDRGITVINVNPEESSVYATIHLRAPASQILPMIL